MSKKCTKLGQEQGSGQEASSNIDGQNAVERLWLQPFPELWKRKLGIRISDK